jgi:chorismate mutase / prephenate dehydratase
MSENEADPVMKQIREQISDIDRSVIEAINRRLKLVAQLKRYKDEQGIDLVDPEREEWMFAYQSRANRGPLSDEGLRAFYAELLALTKREVSS